MALPSFYFAKCDCPFYSGKILMYPSPHRESRGFRKKGEGLRDKGDRMKG